MDTTQLLLTVVLSVTTLLLIFVGVQLIFVLREIRWILQKANNIVSGFEKLGVSVEQGMSEMHGFMSAMKVMLKVAQVIRDKKNDKTT